MYFVICQCSGARETIKPRVTTVQHLTVGRSLPLFFQMQSLIAMLLFLVQNLRFNSEVQSGALVLGDASDI